jgi:hypothetical protein
MTQFEQRRKKDAFSRQKCDNEIKGDIVGFGMATMKKKNYRGFYV